MQQLSIQIENCTALFATHLMVSKSIVPLNNQLHLHKNTNIPFGLVTVFNIGNKRS